MARFNPDDPYDLSIVDYENLNGLKEYYTLRYSNKLLVKKDSAISLQANQWASCKWISGLKKETITMISRDLHFSLNSENGRPLKCGGKMSQNIRP